MPDNDTRELFYRYTEKASYRDGLLKAKVEANTDRSKNNQKVLHEFIGGFWTKQITIAFTAVGVIIAILKLGAEIFGG